MALLGDIAGHPLHTNREKIEISQVFIEILGFKVLPIFTRNKGNAWRVVGAPCGAAHAAICTRAVEAFLKETVIAYRQNLVLFLEFRWHAIAVLFKTTAD